MHTRVAVISTAALISAGALLAARGQAPQKAAASVVVYKSAT